jgi:hypothetical protein
MLGVRVLPALSWIQNGILMDADVCELFVLESAWLFRQGRSSFKCSNKMTLFVQYFIPSKQLYMFRVKHSSIIRSSNKL